MVAWQERVPTGIEGLDEVLGGGYPRHTMLLLRGEPGTGKTTAGLQFMAAGVARGERVLFVSLSQTHDQLASIAATHGISIDGVRIESLDTLTSRRDRSVSVDTHDAMQVELVRRIHEALDAGAPDLFVFDSLLELRLLSGEAMAYRTAVLDLRRRLAERGTTALVIDHMDAPIADNQVEGLAHGAIHLTAESPPIGISRRRLHVSKLRGSPFREGYHDFRIVTGGLTVFPRIVPATLDEGGLGASLASGQAALDEMLGGGLEFGTTTLITGQAGTGKSTLAALFAVAAVAAGARAALYLFEERPEVFRTRSAAVGVDMPGAERAGLLDTHNFHPAEISPGEFSRTVVQSVEEDGVRLVVIDSLSGYLNALPDRENVIIHLHTLLQYLARRGVLVIVTLAQHGLLGEDPRSDLDTSYLADSVILLRHYAAGSEVRRSLAILKKRHSDHERKIQEFVIRPGAVEVKGLADEMAERQQGGRLVGGP